MAKVTPTYFYMRTLGLSRRSGDSLVAAIAYRFGLKLTDPATGIVYDYSWREDVVFSKIVSARKLEHSLLELIDSYERSERRKDSNLGRDILVALPRCLIDRPEVCQELAHAYALHIAKRFNGVVWVAIHWSEGNPHIHLVLPNREYCPIVGADPSTRLDDLINPAKSGKILKELRMTWAELQNEKFEELGMPNRVDHRSYAEQGLPFLGQIHKGRWPTQLQNEAEELNAIILEHNALLEELLEVRQQLQKIEGPEQKSLQNGRESDTEDPFIQTERKLNLKRYRQAYQATEAPSKDASDSVTLPLETRLPSDDHPVSKANLEDKKTKDSSKAKQASVGLTQTTQHPPFFEASDNRSEEEEEEEEKKRRLRDSQRKEAKIQSTLLPNQNPTTSLKKASKTKKLEGSSESRTSTPSSSKPCANDNQNGANKNSDAIDSNDSQSRRTKGVSRSHNLANPAVNPKQKSSTQDPELSHSNISIQAHGNESYREDSSADIASPTSTESPSDVAKTERMVSTPLTSLKPEKLHRPLPTRAKKDSKAANENKKPHVEAPHPASSDSKLGSTQQPHPETVGSIDVSETDPILYQAYLERKAAIKNFPIKLPYLGRRPLNLSPHELELASAHIRNQPWPKYDRTWIERLAAKLEKKSPEFEKTRDYEGPSLG